MTDQSAVVWAATFVPSRSPFEGFGAEGYSVAWVDGPGGREQVLVEGAAPPPHTKGRLVSRTLGEEARTFFVADVA